MRSAFLAVAEECVEDQIGVRQVGCADRGGDAGADEDLVLPLGDG